MTLPQPPTAQFLRHRYSFWFLVSVLPCTRGRMMRNPCLKKLHFTSDLTFRFSKHRFHLSCCSVQLNSITGGVWSLISRNYCPVYSNYGVGWYGAASGTMTEYYVRGSAPGPTLRRSQIRITNAMKTAQLSWGVHVATAFNMHMYSLPAESHVCRWLLPHFRVHHCDLHNVSCSCSHKRGNFTLRPCNGNVSHLPFHGRWLL